MSTAATPERGGEAKPIGAIAGLLGKELSRKSRAMHRSGNPRSGQPVWRNSYHEGQIEDRIWKRIGDGSKRSGRRFTGALKKAARRLEMESRAKRRETEPGTENGALGVIGLEVFDFLCDTVDFLTGRLEPAIATIAAAIGRSYSATHDALKRVRDAGLLSWIRRSKPVDNPEPGGPLVQQITNAYVLLIPEGLKGWWQRTFGLVPAPACEEARRTQDKDDFDRMLAGLTSREFNRDFPSRDPLLGPTLASLAAARDAMEERDRESDRRGETRGVLRTP